MTVLRPQSNKNRGLRTSNLLTASLLKYFYDVLMVIWKNLRKRFWATNDQAEWLLYWLWPKWDSLEEANRGASSSTLTSEAEFLPILSPLLLLIVSSGTYRSDDFFSILNSCQRGANQLKTSLTQNRGTLSGKKRK